MTDGNVPSASPLGRPLRAERRLPLRAVIPAIKAGYAASRKQISIAACDFEPAPDVADTPIAKSFKDIGTTSERETSIKCAVHRPLL